jgi:spore germination protein YaaH
MSWQWLGRSIAVGLAAVAGLTTFMIGFEARSAQAQTAITATPIAGIPVTYTVKSGDTFNSIARQFDLTPQQLQALNTLSDINLIRVGQVLTVGINAFTPTPTATPTRISAPSSTTSPTATATNRPTATPTVSPTEIPTHQPVVTDRPTTTLAPRPVAPPASRSSGGIPPDVIMVFILMGCAVIGIIIGFRKQGR